MASTGQAAIQRVQPMHSASLICERKSTRRSAHNWGPAALAGDAEQSLPSALMERASLRGGSD